MLQWICPESKKEKNLKKEREKEKESQEERRGKGLIERWNFTGKEKLRFEETSALRLSLRFLLLMSQTLLSVYLSGQLQCRGLKFTPEVNASLVSFHFLLPYPTATFPQSLLAKQPSPPSTINHVDSSKSQNFYVMNSVWLLRINSTPCFPWRHLCLIKRTVQEY